MAEVLTFAAHPPFGLDQVLDPGARLAIVGPEAAYNAVVGASPEVVASALIEVDATAQASAPLHPALASLHTMGKELGKQAQFDPSAKRMLPSVKRVDAYKLGVYVAASAVGKHLVDSRKTCADLVGDYLYTRAQALLTSQTDYEPDSRKQVFSAALDVALDSDARGSIADSLAKQLIGEVSTATPEQVATLAMDYWRSEPPKYLEQVVDYTRLRLAPPAVKADNLTPEQLFATMPEFVTTVMAGTELTEDVSEVPRQKLYIGGIHRAIAYISRVTAVGASGEFADTISA